MTEELALRAYTQRRDASSAVMLAASRYIAEQDRRFVGATSGSTGP